MNIVLVNAVYPPEPVVSAQMGRDLAEELMRRGAKVSVLCPQPSRPMGADYSAFRSEMPLVAVENGITVVRFPSFAAPQSRLLPRMWESWSFGRHVCRYLKENRSNVDVVYANTWPLISQALLARYCAKWRIPLVLHVQDIYPESLLDKLPGFIRKVIATPLVSLDRWTALQAAKVVTISENMRRLFMETRGLATDRIITILNWVNDERFAQLPDRKDAFARFGIPEGRFIFLYLGSLSLSTDMELAIRAFHTTALAHSQLLIIGDGSQKYNCVSLVNRLQMSHVRFLSCASPDDVPAMQSMADVCLLPLKRGVALNAVPSKLPAYLFSAKPVMAMLDAESFSARCIKDAQCGWVGEPENVEWLANQMREVAAMPAAELEAMGQRGRAYGLKHFSKIEGVRKLADVIVGAQRSGNKESAGQPERK